ncbi:MAG: glycosyltransferase family 2 protein [Treponema sp.]|nr:glycosyltransferase family 2 protein [Treponema sp.]MEE3435015.1 glycosyltransferase family 2 protein [Treponema sp.]
MDVSIIIVNYNTKQLLSDCIKSIYEHTTGLEYEIIVSDNGSKDGSIEMIKTDFPHVALVENNANLGFGAANNRGLAVAKGKYVFYLNSDTILLNNAIKLFFDYFESHGSSENIGALGANLLNKDMQIIHSYGAFITSKAFINELFHTLYGVTKLSLLYLLFGRTAKKSADDSIKQFYVGQVDYITGADLFMLNDQTARFDESYFMYAEEMDLQYNIQKFGKKRLLIDGPQIMHLQGCSAEKSPDLLHIHGTFSHIYNNISRALYLKKHGCGIVSLLLIKLLICFIWINPAIIKKTAKYFPILLKV